VCEQVCETFGREYGMECAVMRITGVWMPEKTASYRAESRAGMAEALQKYWWTWVDARDVARAFRLALEAPSLPAFGTYFLAAADSLIDEPTAEAVRKLWPGTRIAGPLEGHASVLSVEAARRAFGWTPRHSWR
jgi:nucleoside-diphosphate-sugar epimerase